MSATVAPPSAIKDDLYRQILAGLEGHLDHQTFEAAVCDLLRDAFPSLVPIPGGSDRGMDGAIADGEGEAFPLVCTTREDVIGNLTASLESYLAGGGTRRKVLLATSQALTPQRRLNLEERAQEKGFVLIQVVEQRGLADRLYRNSRWLKELLDLTGAPSALSAVPLTRRPLVELPPVGREKELEWLHSTSGDRLIVGQPGSGKTFLLTQLVREWGWLFLVSDDETGIAAALRDQQPAVVIVNDAHTDPSQLDRLRHLRQEQGAQFDIVATTWPGEQAAVLSALGTPEENQVLKLELMPRREIKALLEHLGIREQETGPELVRELIEQSANKPGLAVTLALVWLRGEWRSLVEGKAIDQALLPLFEERVGKEVRGFLASFALGGSRGLSLGAVSAFHGLSEPVAWQKATSLAAGGVLADVDRKTLAVEPRVLRVSLVRTVFFPDEGPRLPCEGLLEQGHPGAAAEILAEAALRGANVPNEVLRLALLRADPRVEIFQIAPRAWSLAAQRSVADAKWVLYHYTGSLSDIAGAALQAAPEEVVPRLLKEAEIANGERYSGPGSPLGLLSAWVQEFEVASASEPLWRHRILVRQAKAYLARGGEHDVGVEALFAALSPRMHSSSRDALGGRVIERSALLPLEHLRAVAGLWEEARAILPRVEAKTWPHLSNFLWDWIYPDSAARGAAVPEEVSTLMHDFARKLLFDLLPQAKGRPGIEAGLQELAEKLEFDLGIEIDPTFSLIFPSPQDGQVEIEAVRPEIEALANRLSGEPPELVADCLAAYLEEAQIINRQYSLQRLVEVCRHLAQRSSLPEVWVKSLLSRDLPGHLVRPFLVEILRRRSEGWEEWALRCLESLSTGSSAFELLLSDTDLPPALRDTTLGQASRFAAEVDTLALRRQVPLPTLSRLLCHSDSEVALAAAVGEWNSQPRGQVRQEVQPEWREAILSAGRSAASDRLPRPAGDYWLAQILARDPELSFEWWRARVREKRLPQFHTEMAPLRATVRVLDLEQRRSLVAELVPQPGLSELLQPLIDRRPEVFRQLLSLSSLVDLHLAALHGKPDPGWADLAYLSVKHGYSAVQVAQAAYLGVVHFMSGSGLEYWTKWDEAFAALESDTRPEVREVAAEGRMIARGHIKQAKEKEQEFELHGW